MDGDKRRKEIMAEHLAKNGVEIKPGVKETLNYLREKGYKLAVATATDRERAEAYLDEIGITEMFDKDGNSTINDPKHVEFLEKFASLYNKYTPESDITNASTEMISAFDSASAAMIFHNIGSYGQHRDTLGDGNFGAVLNLKSVEDTNVMVSNGVASLSVFKNSEHPE